jgi:predicted nucleotidyltransferase component of viral defense system
VITPDQVRAFSKRLAIDEFTTIREYLQVVFLSSLYREKQARNIYFKGGTAIRLFLNSNRFSEDLDFTAEMRPEAVGQIVDDAVKNVSLIVPGIAFKKVKEKGHMPRGKALNKSSFAGILAYQAEGMRYSLNIHLDFSLREKPQTARETVLTTDFPVAPVPIIRHLDWPEILAEKIRAFLYRSKGRDIYDLWHLLRNGVELDWKLINKKMKLYGMSASLGVLVKRIENFDERRLRSDLGKYLPTQERSLIDHLTNLAMEQLESRREFSISKSVHLLGSGTWGGSYSGSDNLIPNLTKTTIKGIRRIGDTLDVEFEDVDHNERRAVIGAKDKVGPLQLDVIAAKAQEFIGKSYDEFIYAKIKFPSVS